MNFVELAYNLLPNLPNNLNWVIGITILIEEIFVFGLLLCPFLLIFGKVKTKKWH